MQQAGAIRAGKAFVEVGANTDGLSAGLRAAQARIAAFGSAVKGLGAGLMGLGMGALVPMAGAVKAFASFESQMATVKAVIQPTAAEFAALNDEALRLGRDTVYSSTDAARAMVEFARAGFSVKQILDATAPVINLAASNAMSMEQATAAVIPVLRGMGMEAAQLTRVVDVLNAAANASYTDVTLLSSGFAYCAADARDAGVSLEDTAAILAVLSDAGIRGEKAGTGFRAILADFKQMTPGAAAALRQLGVVLHDANMGWRKPGEILADMGAKLKGMGSFARSQWIAKIFDVRSGSGASVVMQEIDKLLAYQQKIASQGGLTGRMAEIKLDTIEGAWKLLTSSVEGFSIEVGKNLSPILREVSDVLVQVANGAAKWAKENPALFQTVLKVAAGVTIAGAALVGMGLTMTAIAPVVGIIASGFATIGMAAKLYLNPTFMMLRQVGFGVHLLRKNTEVGKVAWQSLAQLAGSVQKSVAEGLQWAYNGLLATLKQMGDSARLAMVGVWDAFQGGDLGGAFEIAKLGAQAAFEDLWGNMKAGGANAFSFLSGSFIKLFISASEKVAHIFVSIFEFLTNVWHRTWGAIKGTWDYKAIQQSREAVQKNAEWAAGKRDSISGKAQAWRDEVDRGTQLDIEATNIKAAGASAGTRAKIAELNAAAQRKRELAEFEAKYKDMGPKLPDGAGSKLLAGLGQGGMFDGKGEVSGTFNAALAGMMGASSINQQIADATKRTADATEKIARKEGGSFS